MEHENELFIRYRETKDVALRNKIAEKYLYIADILAKKFVGRGVEFDDLKQVASLALLRGIDRFDPSLGMKFTTFITPTVTGEIKNYFRDKLRMIKLPRRLSEISAKVKNYASDYESQHGEKPAVKEIAQALSLTEEEVVQALEVGGISSLDAVTGDEADAPLYAVIPDQDDSYEKMEMRDALAASMKDFTDTERAIISFRYQDGLSQSETAARLGVSQMFVSRMERKLLARLKDRLQDTV